MGVARVELLGGRYRVGDLLGRGGMGEVYRAVDTVHDRQVALKLLPPSADERYADRLRREAELVSRLADPHIVEVYDTGDGGPDGGRYVAMRLVEGADLRRVLAGGPLEPRRAVAILAQVAAALDTAHAGGIVHRDVKPSNILLGPGDDAYLTDFGIARPLDAGATRLTRTGSYVGSLDYIAPEQLRGQDVTGTADVYSLACVLYECLTGKVPFPAEDPAAKLAAQLNDPPAAPSVFDPTIPPALDLVLATGMDKDPGRRFESAGELLAAANATLADEVPAAEPELTAPGGAGEPARDAIVSAIVTVSARRQRRALPAPPGAAPAGDGEACPYPGLRSFGTGDAAWFHGREAEITELLVRLTRQAAGSGPLVVVGASGAGKSSVLRAGLFPALDEAGVPWPRIVLTPGERPVETLATRLAAAIGADPATLAAAVRDDPESFGERHLDGAAPDGARLLIVVDQFEQLFTDGADPAERAAFATALAHAWPAVVLLAVRADYLPDCIGLGPLRAALDHPVVVGPLGNAELRQVIVLPAHDAGLTIEDGLVERLIGDAGARDGAPGEHGMLPRLAHALRETWHNRAGTVLTLGGYQATGGVDRAVAVSADQLYQRLEPGRAAALRETLLRLVKVLPDGGLARRRAGRDELDAQAVADLVAARLAAVDGDGVRLSHDALLTAWPRLRDWVEEQRHDILLGQRLDEAAANWRESGRDRGDLYRGSRLAGALEWADGGRALTGGQREFLTASRREQQRATRRLRGVVAGLTVLLVAALVAGGLAVAASNEADRQAAVALSRQLAAESRALAEWDPVGARRTALRAWQAAPTAEARGALLSADSLTEVAGFDSGLDPATAVDVSEGGRLIAVGGTDDAGATTVVVRDTATGEVTALDGDLGEDTVQSIRFSPDGSLLAVAVFGSPGVRVWEVPSGRPVTALESDGEVIGPIAWHPDGTSLAGQALVGEESRIGTWDPRTGQRRRWLADPAPGEAMAYTLAYGESRLAVGRIDGSVALWDPGTGERVLHSTAHRDAVTGEPGGIPVAVALSDGLLASASPYDNRIRLYDAARGGPAGEIADRTRATGDAAQGPNIISFSGDGSRLLTATGGRVIVWDPVDRKRLGEFARGRSAGTAAGMTVTALAVTADASTTVSARKEGRVVYWRRNTPWYEAPRGSVLGVAFDPAGTRATAVDGTGEAHTWDWRSGGRTGPPGELTAPGMGVAYAPDGTRVTGALDGVLTVTPPEGEPVRLTMDGYRFRGELAISKDGSLLAAAGEHPDDAGGAGRVYVWNLATRQPRAVLDLDAGSASAIAFRPDGSRLLAVSSHSSLDGEGTNGDGPSVTLTTWRTARLDAPPESARIGDDIVDAAYAPDGRSIVAASVTGTIQVRDPSGGTLRREFGAHPSAVRALALAPDGRTLATATTDDSAVWLWDLAEGTLRARLTSGQGFEVNDLAFSPDGSALARAGTDAAVALWRIDTERAAERICRSLVSAGHPREC